jgi:uncharacterized protein YbcV (DUF1398 family)
VHDPYAVSDIADPKAARAAIEAHGRGDTDYFAFSRALADAGVASWVMDPVRMTLTYRSAEGTPMLADNL